MKSLRCYLKRLFIVSFVICLTISSIHVTNVKHVHAETDAPDTIYYNGTIITMDRNETIAETVAVKDGKIIAVGKKDDILQLKSDETTRMVDLDNHVMLPGFYDAHSHFPQSALVGTYSVNLQYPPLGPVENLDDLLAALKEKAERTEKGKWIEGFGFDQNTQMDGKLPTRWDLDKVSTEHPIIIIDTSYHLAVVNSLALELSGITKDTPDPPGGQVVKDPVTGEPNGQLLELSARRLLNCPGPTEEDMVEVVKADVKNYAANGVTTSIVAGGNYETFKNYKELGLLPFRMTIMGTNTPNPPKREEGDDILRPGAVKLFHDGIVMGYTGYLSEPYVRGPNGETDYYGAPQQSREELTDIVVRLHKEGYQIAIHADGDGAIDDILHAYETAQSLYPRPDARQRIEHAVFARKDQVEKMIELGVTPSYFVSTAFYYGDAFINYVGEERAMNIAPLKTSVKNGVKFSLHLDSPITQMRPLEAAWAAVNRVTRNGLILGAHERVTPMEALRAITIDAAWQNFEEDIKGSIEPGKYADFVILEENPLTIDPQKIKDINILETIVGDVTIYTSEEKGDETEPETKAPIIQYDGEKVIEVEYKAAFQFPEVFVIHETETIEPTFTIKDEAGNEIAADKFSTEQPGKYTFTYSAEDSNGNKAEDLVITVIVLQAETPDELSFDYDGKTEFTVDYGAEFKIPEIHAKDSSGNMVKQLLQSLIQMTKLPLC